MLMKIMCAKCRRDVDWVGVKELAHFNAYTITAHCHSESETRELTRTFIAEAEAEGYLYLPGVAFDKTLPAENTS